MTRLGPDVDLLLHEILAAALDESVTVVEFLPPDYALRYPVVVATRTSGAQVDIEFGFDRALCQVDVYDDNRTDALNLADQCRQALFYAWKYQTPFPHGSITSYGEQAAPAALVTANQPSGETFVPATYQLYVCP